jgi:hypothetical protein
MKSSVSMPHHNGKDSTAKVVVGKNFRENYIGRARKKNCHIIQF